MSTNPLRGRRYPPPDEWDFSHEPDDGSLPPPVAARWREERERRHDRVRSILLVGLVVSGYGLLVLFGTLTVAGVVRPVVGAAAAGEIGPIVAAASIAVAYYFYKDGGHV